MTGNKHHRPGFTLIEMLVVAASFSMIFLVATTVYTNQLRQQKKTQSTQRVTADARYLIETLARAIRTGAINYDYYRTQYLTNSIAPNTPLANLALVGNCFGVASNHFWTGAECGSLGNTITSTDITPSDITIDDFHVYITPFSDPFQTNSGTTTCDTAQTNVSNYANPACNYNATSNLTDQWCCPSDISTCRPDLQGSSGTQKVTGICINANIQPAVTIVLRSTSNVGEKTQSTIQTTVVTRTYKR